MSFKNVVSFLSKQSKQILETFCQLRWKVILAGVLVGVVSGSLVAFYRFGIDYGTDFARWM